MLVLQNHINLFNTLSIHMYVNMEKLFIVQQYINFISMKNLWYKVIIFFCFQFLHEKYIIQPVALLQVNR